MDETTKQALNDFVKKIIDAAQSGAAWSVEQAPLIVQEWLQWVFWSNAINAAIYVLIILFSFLVYVVGLRKGLQYAEAQKKPLAYGAWDWEFFSYMWGGIGAVVVAPISFCLLVSIWSHALLAIKVAVAPRVMVIEKISELLK